MSKKITVKQVRSGAHYGKKQQATLRGLGLGKPQQSAKLEDSPAVRGMIRAVTHLVKVEE
ncbi:MAG: 50S ribosomal protein L30 [Deltaproteobacteria bacterium]|nr:50S ribosomal protein L30 [Deltaproteobacteria bacterium]